MAYYQLVPVPVSHVLSLNVANRGLCSCWCCNLSRQWWWRRRCRRRRSTPTARTPRKNWASRPEMSWRSMNAMWQDWSAGGCARTPVVSASPRATDCIFSHQPMSRMPTVATTRRLTLGNRILHQLWSLVPQRRHSVDTQHTTTRSVSALWIVIF